MRGAAQIKITMGAGEWGLLLTLSILWGGSFFFVEVALSEVGPFTIVLVRVGLAAFALMAVEIITRGKLTSDGGLWLAFFVMGALNNVLPFSLIVWGQTQIASGLAAVLNATTPIFTVVLAHILTSDEKVTAGRLLGVLLGLLGVTVMIGPEVLTGMSANLLAQLAILGAAISYALAGIFGRRFSGLSPISVASGQVTASTVMMLPIALFVEKPWALPLPGLEVWASLVALALLSTALAYVLYFRILSAAGASNLLLVTLLVPVSAILLGVGVLGEVLTAGQLIGMACIGLGLVAMDGRLLTLLRRRGGAT